MRPPPGSVQARRPSLDRRHSQAPGLRPATDAVETVPLRSTGHSSVPVQRTPASPIRSPTPTAVRPSTGQRPSSNRFLAHEAARKLALEHLNAGRLSEAKPLINSLLEHGVEDPELRYQYALALIRA